MAAQTQISSTTQEFLEIYDITGDIVILKDGSTSLLLSVDAINFGLLAEEEQDAVIYSYAGLLNSLNYNIQIVISSITKDVSKYLHQLDEQIALSNDRLRQGQIKQYRDFVATLIQERNVLDKKFYIVIPASALEMGLLPPSTVIPGSKAPDISTIERSVILERARNVLEPKRDHLIGQFARIGLYARQVETQEIIQLFYGSYNPEASEGQQITDSKDYTTPIVNARIQGVTMTDPNNPLTQTPAAVNQPQPVQPTTPQTPTPTPAPAMNSNVNMTQVEQPVGAQPTPPAKPALTPPATPPATPTPTPPAPAAAQAPTNTPTQSPTGVGQPQPTQPAPPAQTSPSVQPPAPATSQPTPATPAPQPVGAAQPTPQPTPPATPTPTPPTSAAVGQPQPQTTKATQPSPSTRESSAPTTPSTPAEPAKSDVSIPKTASVSAMGDASVGNIQNQSPTTSPTSDATPSQKVNQDQSSEKKEDALPPLPEI